MDDDTAPLAPPAPPTPPAPATNVFKLVPKYEPTDEQSSQQKNQLLGQIQELWRLAVAGELEGLAFVGSYTKERFSVAWVGHVELPHMVGYLEFLQQQIIAQTYLSGTIQE